jgi:aminoglycoside phosphotransferase (APT) family kinase protein
MPGVDIDEPLVRCLLREQHPDLAELELREVPGGWDNRMWRLGEDLAIRLPLTPRAPYLLDNERRWLPVLAPRLPLPVPEPLRAGEPSPRFPSTWAIVRWVDGDPADRSPISSPDAARTLAGFLRALHCDAPADAPVNPSRSVPLQALRGEFGKWHEYVLPPAAGATGQHDLDVSAVRAAWERAVAAPLWSRAPVWIHGDLHPANVTVAHGTLAGVIDFGDMCAGDPAMDLSAAWLLLPAGTTSQFFDAYGIADDATIARARGWAVVRAVMLMGIGKNGELGLPGGKKTWGPAGRAGLRRVLAGN